MCMNMCKRHNVSTVLYSFNITLVSIYTCRCTFSSAHKQNLHNNSYTILWLKANTRTIPGPLTCTTNVKTLTFWCVAYLFVLWLFGLLWALHGHHSIVMQQVVDAFIASSVSETSRRTNVHMNKKIFFKVARKCNWLLPTLNCHVGLR